MIWASVAPPGRLSRARTIAVLLPSRGADGGRGGFCALGAFGRFLGRGGLLPRPLLGGRYWNRTQAVPHTIPETRFPLYNGLLGYGRRRHNGAPGALERRRLERP